jgi:uncharacterized membrane protein (UPF0127 family)
MRLIDIQNQSNSLSSPLTVEVCNSFFSRLRGLMFRKSLPVTAGILLDEKRESRIEAAIHMFFVNFDIGVIWLDVNQIVVDAQIARRWRPLYTPSVPARYILEIHPTRFSEFRIGDRLLIHDAS